MTRTPMFICRIACAVVLLAISQASAAQQQFATPELALAYYFKSLNAHDLGGVNATFLIPVPAFDFTAAPPTESFLVIRRTEYTEDKVREWKKMGAVSPIAVGDIELHVQEIFGGKPHMYSYNFRNTAAGWKIVTFVAWDGK